MKHSKLLLSLAGLLMMSCAAAARADDYYADRLREGTEAARAGNYALAIDEFRIAAFGFLDSPVLYEETAARLALAQAADGKAGDARATLKRFLEIERRFKAFAKTPLDAETREAFRKLLLRENPSALTDAPSLAPSAAEEEQRFASLAPKERESELARRAAADARDARWPAGLARLALERHDDREALAWAEKALAIEPARPDALAIKAHVLAGRGRCPAALPIFKELSADAFKEWPDLEADFFVCAVDQKSWSDARDVQARIPATADGRKDVGHARADLAEQTRKDTAEQARKEKTEKDEQARKEKTERDEQARTEKREKDEQARKERAEKDEQARREKDDRARMETERAAQDRASAPESPPPPAPEASPVDDLAVDHALVLAGKPANAEKDLQRKIKKEPERRDLHLAVLEAACLAKHWSVASKELAALVPFSETEVLFMFYAAVVSYETGKVEDARIYLARSVSRIVETPYTRYYSEKISGK